MNRKECRLTRQEIDQSELNGRLSNQALAHVAGCSACRDFRSERTQLRELVGSLEPVTAPANFEMRLRARITAEQQGNARQPFFAGFALSTPAMAGAALLLVSLASAVWFVEQRRNLSTPIAITTKVKETQSPGPNAVPAGPEDKLLAGSVPAGTVTPADNGGNQGSRSLISSNPKVNQTSVVRNTGSKSRDFGVGPAPSIRHSFDSAGQVSLAAPDKPLVLSIQDDHGATRRISLPPVSFGSQRLVDNRFPVTQTSARIW